MPATEPAHGADPDLILDDDDQPDSSGSPAQEEAPWRILIVDDDVDVHVVTKFALSNANFLGRRLSFLHAYSGAEALAVLRNTPDIALVLLDVIMETNDAGLQLARQIRDDLHNELVRIVLRTGQPGQALEHSIIVDYDINDFWSKGDLTTRKLFTTVIASLRAYATLAAAAKARDALNAQLAHAKQVQAVVEQHALLLTLDPHGRIVEANDRFCALAGLTREQLIGRKLQTLAPVPEQQTGDIIASLARNGNWAGEIRTTQGAGKAIDLRCAVLAFKDANGATREYVAVATALDQGCSR
jgi:PAS domain S-box-containing protein